MFHPHGIRVVLIGMTGSCLLGLSACTTSQTTQTGFLSDYSLLAKRTDSVWTNVSQHKNDVLLNQVRSVHIEPTVIGEGVGTRFSEEEKALILSEMDRQLCYEVSERFEISPQPSEQAARLRVAATRVLPTNAVGSAASAVAGRFIPGPVGIRIPGSTGGLAAEAELIMPDGQQAAAIVWARDAQIIGTDNPSLSRIGDAHQLAEPLGDLVAAAITPEGYQNRPIPTPDPCERFGPRIRPEGFVARVVTGLYTPELSGGTQTRQVEEPKP